LIYTGALTGWKTNSPQLSNVYSKASTDNQILVAISGLLGSAPAAYDTLQEVAAQLASDQTLHASLLTQIGAKANQTTTYTKTEVNALISGAASTSTTLAGYGITDAYTKAQTDSQITSTCYTKTQTDMQIASAVAAGGGGGSMSGAMGIAAGGLQNANFSALTNTSYVLTANLVVTIPAGVALQDIIELTDGNGTLSACSITCSEPIQGLGTAFTLDIPNFAVRLVYLGAGVGWKVFNGGPSFCSSVANPDAMLGKGGLKNSSFSAVIDTTYLIGANCSVALPTNGILQSFIELTDVAGTLNNVQLTSSEPINGSASPYILDVPNFSAKLLYMGTGVGWRVYQIL
jgi:hypothetical protein